MIEHHILSTEPNDTTGLAVFTALRGIDTNIKHLGDAVAELKSESKDQSRTLAAVSERLIKIEASNMLEKVKALEIKVDVVESTISEIKGAGKFAEWSRNFAPVLLFVVFVAIEYFNKHA